MDKEQCLHKEHSAIYQRFYVIHTFHLGIRLVVKILS